MAAGRTGPPLETAHVLFVDIVGYSAQPMETQRRWWEELQALVRQNAERSSGSGDCVRIPTGDGMAIVFFRDPVAPLQCAIALSQALQRRPELRLRMGLHTGPVYRVADINAQANVAGGGINYAQRVMECGDAGHILLSSQIAQQVQQVEPWPLHDLGVCEVKHGERLHLFNLYRDEIGNPHRPQKLRAAVPPARPPAEPPDPTRSKTGLPLAARPIRPSGDPSPRGQDVGFRMEEAPLSIRLLGGFEVRVGSQPIRSVRTRSVEWLLALLVLRHGRDVSRSWLAGTLWPESREAQGLFNLRRNLLDLRQALGAAADRLRTPNRATLCLDLTGADVDLLGFDAAIAAGDERSLQAAVALYRGPLLEGCVETWVLPGRASREEACLQALEKLADQAMERGELAAALAALGQAAALDALRDSTQRRRMQALTASGDLPAALVTYREHRLRLHRELNVEPDPETTRLFYQLRSGARRTTLRHSSPHTGTSEPDPTANTRAVEDQLPDQDQIQNPNAQRAPEIQNPAPLPRPLTALIGREAAVREVVQTVRTSRLVTLVGGGGVGKTRLAIQAAEDLTPAFPAGVAFIELAALAEPSLLPAHVAGALGVREVPPAAGAGPPGPEPLLQALTDWLTPSPVLLVLDNCEHLIEAAAALAHALLAACPALRVLATSRQRLGVTGEVVWRVPSLPVPDEGVGYRVKGVGSDKVNPTPPYTLSPPPSTLMEYASVQLFVERAAAVRTGFEFGNREEALAVARICRRLDGIPLALELAAARVGLLTLPQIAARLDDRFRLLTGGSRAALPRHQTLAALIDWSYELLPEAERALFRRLSVFAGGWTLEAAEAVAALQGVGRRVWGVGSDKVGPDPPYTPHPTPDTLDLLGALEEKSLVLVELREGAIRYRMLETVREYARERLVEAGEEEAVRERHGGWFLALAEAAAPELFGSEPAVWFDRLEREHDNLRAALGWCLKAGIRGQGPGKTNEGTRLCRT